MQVKMIVTDLDRTLLHSDKTISANTAEVLCACRQQGIVVVFATARPLRTVTQYLEAVPVDALILHNGAVVYKACERLRHCGIKAETAKHILLSISRDYPEVALSVEIDDVFYANFDVSTVWNYTDAIRTDFTDLPDKTAEKIVICISSKEDIKQYSRYLTDDLYIEANDGMLGLIMNRGATKQSAVKLLADYFGFSMNETVAFGDDYNDLQMIRECGKGISMGNALDEVKAAADYICGTNDDDGVAKWIKENIK